MSYIYIAKFETDSCAVCAVCLTSTTFLYLIPFTSPTHSLSLCKDARFTDFVFDWAVPNN